MKQPLVTGVLFAFGHRGIKVARSFDSAQPIATEKVHPPFASLRMTELENETFAESQLVLRPVVYLVEDQNYCRLV